MEEVATTSIKEKGEASGKLVIDFYSNSVDMIFKGDIKGKELDVAIRLIPRRYKMWRVEQLKQLERK